MLELSLDLNPKQPNSMKMRKYVRKWKIYCQEPCNIFIMRIWELLWIALIYEWVWLMLTWPWWVVAVICVIWEVLRVGDELTLISLFFPPFSCWTQMPVRLPVRLFWCLLCAWWGGLDQSLPGSQYCESGRVFLNTLLKIIFPVLFCSVDLWRECIWKFLILRF